MNTFQIISDFFCFWHILFAYEGTTLLVHAMAVTPLWMRDVRISQMEKKLYFVIRATFTKCLPRVEKRYS